MSTQGFYVRARALPSHGSPFPSASQLYSTQTDERWYKRFGSSSWAYEKGHTSQGSRPFALNVDWETAFAHRTLYSSVTVLMFFNAEIGTFLSWTGHYDVETDCVSEMIIVKRDHPYLYLCPYKLCSHHVILLGTGKNGFRGKKIKTRFTAQRNSVTRCKTKPCYQLSQLTLGFYIQLGVRSCGRGGVFNYKPHWKEPWRNFVVIYDKKR